MLVEKKVIYITVNNLQKVDETNKCQIPNSIEPELKNEYVSQSKLCFSSKDTQDNKMNIDINFINPVQGSSQSDFNLSLKEKFFQLKGKFKYKIRKDQ